MLRNFIATLILSLTSLAALANGYCDARPSMTERRNCYANLEAMDGKLAQLAVQQMHNNIDALKKAPVPPAALNAFLAEVKNDRANIDSTCTTNKCVHSNVVRLNNKMAAWYNQQTAKK